MLFHRSKSITRNRTNSINNNSEDEQIKNIIKEINRDYRNAFFFDYKSPTKIRSFIRNKSTLNSDKIRNTYKKIFKRDKKENSLSFKLKDKITKENLILELRQELKYHIKFNAVYNNLLTKIIHLKEIVKENKDKVQEKTDILKETFKDRFDVIDQYERTITLLQEEKKDIVKTNKDIVKVKENTNSKLIKEFNDIQERNNKQREKIDSLQNNINSLEYKKNHLNEELQSQLEKEEKNYEQHLKLYKLLYNKYQYFLEEYNTFLKSGDEITKIDVKLFDDTNAKNYLIEENLEVELNEKLIKKSFLLNNINNLKLQIKLIEEKQLEEKLKEEKKEQACKLMGKNKYKLRKSKNSKIKWGNTTGKKSLSYNNIFLSK